MTKQKVNYQPTFQEKEKLKMKEGMFKISGDGVFATLQGEGITAGEPAVFLRLHFCNLACGFWGGWKCDTSYTWNKTTPEFWQEPEDWDIKETAQRIIDIWESTKWKEKFGKTGERRLVLTGGEPLLQQNNITTLLKFLQNWKIEIETNGTILPHDDLYYCQINCSPKLKNSGNQKSIRFKPEVLKRINSWPNSWFKFVIVKKSDLKEVKRIAQECGLVNEKILIMPEGHTIEDVNTKAHLISDIVLQYGWKMTNRNQLLWFGPKRRT